MNPVSVLNRALLALVDPRAIGDGLGRSASSPC